MPLNLSELIEEFAEIDKEALEEEEVSIAHMTKIGPVVASKTLLHHADDILQSSVENRKDLSSEGEKVVNDTVNAIIEEAPLPIDSHGHGQEGVGICSSQSMSSKPPGQDQDVQVSEPSGKGNDAVLSSGHDRNAITCPVRQPSPSDNLDLDGIEDSVSTLFSIVVCFELERSITFSKPIITSIGLLQTIRISPPFTKPIVLNSMVVLQHADGNQGDHVKCPNEENPLGIALDSASPFLKGLDDQARYAILSYRNEMGVLDVWTGWIM